MATDGRRELTLDAFEPEFVADRRAWALLLGAPVSCSAPSRVAGVWGILRGLFSVLADLDPSAPPAAAEAAQRAVAEFLDSDRGLIAQKVPFEVILGQVADHTRGFVPDYLVRLMPPGTPPNANHFAASALVAAGRVRVVITTNFDECIEAANGCQLPVVVPVEGTFTPPPEPYVLKLHGTISEPDSLGATPSGLARRANVEWQHAIARAIGSSPVLMVGYSISDVFDITPALIEAQANGAEFHWTCTANSIRDAKPLPLATAISHDLSRPEANALVRLAGTSPALTADDCAINSSALAVAALEHCRQAALASRLTSSERLAALAALYYWIERGEDALALYKRASRFPDSRVDGHAIARALMRARRYWAASRAFDRLLRENLPESRTERYRAAIDWNVGAGFCASTGGRPVASSHYYRRARAAFNEGVRSGALHPWRITLGPQLADQLLRSQAGHEVRVAAWHGGARRERHLQRASAYLDALETVGSLDLATAPLIPMERARIALLRADRATALRELSLAHQRIDHLSDPHAQTVCDRLTAITRGDRAALLTLARETKQAGRTLESVKIVGEALGVHKYGRGTAAKFALRALVLVGWDVIGELLARGRERQRRRPR